MVYKAIRARMKNERIEWSMEMCILGGLAGLVLLDIKLLPLAPFVFLLLSIPHFQKATYLNQTSQPIFIKSMQSENAEVCYVQVKIN